MFAGDVGEGRQNKTFPIVYHGDYCQKHKKTVKHYFSYMPLFFTFKQPNLHHTFVHSLETYYEGRETPSLPPNYIIKALMFITNYNSTC